MGGNGEYINWLLRLLRTRVSLLTDVELNESVCTICRSYDVVRDTIRNRPSGKFSNHELASIFESAFGGAQ